MTETGPGKTTKLTAEEFALIRAVLDASDDEEDREIAGTLGRRTLTDDERGRVRRLLALEMLSYPLLPDGSLGPEGRGIDTIIGKLMDY